MSSIETNMRTYWVERLKKMKLNDKTAKIISDMEDPTFVNPSYERPIYNSLLKKIYYFLSSYDSVTENYTIGAEVWCNNIILTHLFDLRGRTIDSSIAKYLMKYFSHTFSTFCPNGKYHYSNDAENYKIGVKTDELFYGGDETITPKLRYIKLYLEPKSGWMYDEECPTELIFDAREEVDPS